MKEKASFFLNLCLPSLDTQSLGAACVLSAVLRMPLESWAGVSLGHLSHAGLWLSAWPGPPGPSKGGLSLRGCAGQVNPRPILRTPAGPQSSCWSPCPVHYFRPSAVGALGFSVLQAHYAATVLDFIPCSQLPLCCCFLCCTVETSLHSSVPLWVLGSS